MARTRDVLPYWRWLGGLLSALFVVVALEDTARANWLTKLVSEAGDVGKGVASKSARIADHDLARAVSSLERVPETKGTLALAAHAGPEGHWQLANRQGDTFTAANAAEMARAVGTLSPGHSGKVAIYLTPEAVFADRSLLDALPDGVELHVVTRAGSRRLIADATHAAGRLRIEFAPNLLLDVVDVAALEEAIYQLGRRLTPSSVRVVALDPGGPDALMRVPRKDKTTKTALVDSVDPASLPDALESVRGQTVVLTGRVAGDELQFVSQSGASGSIGIERLRQAARDQDVNLVVVRGGSGRQPGGRNWLWQTVSVPGMSEAMKQPTFGDFLSTLAGRETPLAVSVRHDPRGRAVIEAVPEGALAVPLPDSVGEWLQTFSGEVMGQILVAGVEADLRDKARQEELDLRIVPGIPSDYQFGYLLLAALSLFGPLTAWRWWRRVWPPESAREYQSPVGLFLAKGVRLLAFVLLFLPLVGLPIAMRALILYLWGILTVPVRVLRWLRSRFAVEAT